MWAILRLGGNGNRGTNKAFVMDVWESWIKGHRWWILAILIAILGSILEILQPHEAPLVGLYLLAALLGVGLSPRNYRFLIGFIVVAMVVPLFFEVTGSDTSQFGAVAQRLVGLLCLGLLVVVVDRRGMLFGAEVVASDPTDRLDSDHWVQGLLGIHPTSDAGALKLLGNDLQDSHCEPDSVAAPAPATSSLTRIHESTHDPANQDGLELSFDHHTSHDDTFGLIERLRASGKFDEDHLELVEAELRSAMGSGMGMDAGTLLEPGVQIGRFIVDEPLGRGGEGHVYRAHDFSGEPAAIKILHNMRVGDRFRREMHLVRQLAHPNIVTAYEVGEYHGLPFITMELLRGPDLQVLVRDSGPLHWRASLKILLQAANALAHAHRRDLIHRDIKPGNLILNGDGVVKLVDLGLASMGGNESGIESVFQFETKDGHLAGTLPYMAPEQARSLAEATVQSDIYGLGATWFYVLTGRERLRGKTFQVQLKNLLLRRRFNPLPDKVLPEPLRQVYRRMVAYDIRDRYADTGQLAADLERAMQNAGESVATAAGINVLVVEDSRTDMVLTIEMLRRSNAALSIHEARNLSDGLGVCRKMAIDLVLLDLSLPDSSGVETVTQFRKVVHDVPLVVLTGRTQDEVGAQCLTAGANTFISKSGLTPHRMERAIFVTLSRCRLPKPPPEDGPKT